MRKIVVHELIKRVLTNNDVYSRIFDAQKIIYIHIPKVAGTSICEAIYGVDTWHFSATELNSINRRKFELYKKIAFVRNPLDRLLSTYRYSKIQILKKPNTSISFMKDANSFDHFLEKYLSVALVKKHYFFWSQTKYLNCKMDFIGKFENMEEEFIKMCEYLDMDLKLEHKNKSVNCDKIIEVKQSNLNKVIDLYRQDYLNYGYTTSADNQFMIIPDIEQYRL